MRRHGLVHETVGCAFDVEDSADWASNLRQSLFTSESFNTLHRYSLDIAKTPFPRYVVPALLTALDRPLLQHFGLCAGELTLDSGFFISYEEGSNQNLRRHVDKCLFTLNLFLEASEDLKGTEVRFHGLKRLLTNDSVEDGPEMFDFNSFAPGTVLMHWGQHEHETLPWKGGVRSSVILWFRHGELTARE